MRVLPSISAGSGPAGAFVAGTALALMGRTDLAFLLFGLGAAMSFFWALRFL